MSLPRAEEWTDPGSMDTPPRRGRRALAVAAVLVVAGLGSFLLWRATSLGAIPNVGEPFDTQAFGTVDVPDEENAFTYYRQAVAKFRDDPSLGGPYHSWTGASEKDREWLFANAEAMELWVQGTMRDRAVEVQPKDFRIESRSEVCRTIRRMAGLAQLVGLRMEAQGQLDQAWVWYRAGLRCSRHCGKNGGFIDRLNGMSLYGRIEKSVRAWADHPNLSPSSLRAALDDVIAIDALTPTFAEGLRAEYFAFSHFLDEPGLSLLKIDREVREIRVRPEGTLFGSMMESFWRFALREPERSRRLIRLVWADWLSVADLPPVERIRRGRKLDRGYYYEPPDDAPEPVRRLTPEALDRWVASTRYLHAMLPGIENVDKADANEETLRASLIVNLAEQLYRLEHGRPPGSPEQLVGPYLKALPPGFQKSGGGSPGLDERRP